MDKEVFYGTMSELATKDTLALISLGYERAFDLNSIEKSSAETEIRIVYFNAFQERFFRQVYNKDSVDIELIDCGTVKRNDSLFMRFGKSLTTKKRFERQVLAMLELLPYRKFVPDSYSTEPLDMDSGNGYFIQVKRKGIVKTILIDKPFDKAPTDQEARYICNFLKTISKCYSFKFDDDWKIIDSLAFKY